MPLIFSVHALQSVFNFRHIAKIYIVYYVILFLLGNKINLIIHGSLNVT